MDISHDVEVGGGLDQMLAESSVSGITIEIPDIEIAPVIVDLSSPTGTGHDPIDPLIFTATITNTMNAPGGNYVGLIKVLEFV